MVWGISNDPKRHFLLNNRILGARWIILLHDNTYILNPCFRSVRENHFNNHWKHQNQTQTFLFVIVELKHVWFSMKRCCTDRTRRIEIFLSFPFEYDIIQYS